MTDSQSPATKEDIRMMMDQIGTYYSQTQHQIGDLNARVTALEGRIDEQEERVKRHFDVVAENLVHDFQGAFHDKLDQHEDRIVTLEHHTGLRT